MDSQPDRTSTAEAQLQEQLLNGVQNIVKQGGRIRDQIRDLFEPYDYVTVKNPFDHATGWAYVDPADEKVEKPDKTTRRVQHGQPKTRILQPGEQVVIHGWEAYIAIERMFKEYAQTKGKAMTVVLSSQNEIDAFVANSFGGVFDPNKMNQMMNATNAPAVAQKIQEEEAAKPAPVPASDPLGFDPAPAAPAAPAQPETPAQPSAPVEPPASVGFDPAQPGGDTSVEQVVDPNQQVVGDSNQQVGNDENDDENA